MSVPIPFMKLSWQSDEPVEVIEPDDFVNIADGKIVSVDDFDREDLIGRFRLYYVDIASALEERIPACDVMDAHSQTTLDYYKALYELGGSEFNEELLSLFNYDVLGMNLLILDRLELLPHHRGQRLGLVIMRRLIQRFSGGAGIVAIKPFPLQFEKGSSDEPERNWRDNLRLSDFPKDEDGAKEKLRYYYSKLGFVPLEGTPYMVLSTAHRLPAMKELNA